MRDKVIDNGLRFKLRLLLNFLFEAQCAHYSPYLSGFSNIQQINLQSDTSGHKSVEF